MKEMKAYVLGAGASVAAGYPLASKLLHRLSDWLDACEPEEPWVSCRNRIVQIKDTFGSLDDFEGVLGKLGDYGHERVMPSRVTTYRQNFADIVHDRNLVAMGLRRSCALAQGFYPQNLRSELIQAFREFF